MILANRLREAGHAGAGGLRFEYVDTQEIATTLTTDSKSVTVPTWARSVFFVATVNWQYTQSTQRVTANKINSVAATKIHDHVGTGSPYPEYGNHSSIWVLNNPDTGTQTWDVERVVGATITANFAMYACNRTCNASAGYDSDDQQAIGAVTCTIDEYRHGLTLAVGCLASTFTSDYDTSAYFPGTISSAMVAGFNLPTADASANTYDMNTGNVNSYYHSVISLRRADFD